MQNSNMIDYRQFRLRKLNTPEFEHLKYLAYWPVFGFLFLLVERIWIRESYFPSYCAWDDAIPFCEYFLIPYLFWFVFLVVIHIYTLLFDIESFVRLMKFIMVSYSAALLIFILFPNCQELRPVSFARDNIFIRFLAGFCRFDTNTNVCPSLHVIGSVAVMLAAWNSKHFSKPGWRIAFCVAAILISVSTVFPKQHSLLGQHRTGNETREGKSNIIEIWISKWGFLHSVTSWHRCGQRRKNFWLRLKNTVFLCKQKP